MIAKQRKKIKFLRVALYLLVGSTFLFSFTNFIFGWPRFIIAYNFFFACAFYALSRLNDELLDIKVFLVGILFQIYIFGHAFYLLPGKQIEAGLGLLIGIAPAFVQGRKLWILFVINLILYHLVIFNAQYESVFVGIYGFYIVMFILVKTIIKENTEYENVLYEQKRQIESDAKELRTLDKLKNNFISNISHELRTPLALIQGPVQSIVDGKKLTGKYANYLFLIKKNSEILLRRVNELIEFSKIGQKNYKLNKNSIHPNEFFQDVLEIFKSKLEIKELKLEYTNDLSTDAYIETDKGKMEIILINLLSNAIKFTPSGGEIGFYIKNDGDFLELEIRDTGMGIAEAEKTKIFERFYQTEHDDYYEGYGLGLALSKELISQLKGEIHVESELGVGSTFLVKIPFKRSLEIELEPDSKKIETRGNIKDDVNNIFISGEKPKRILVVEDNDDLRFYIQSILENSYNPIGAGNGISALEWLRLGEEKGELPDLIVTDLMMPKMDGHEFISTLKNSANWRSIPVIVVTALSSEHVKLDALRVGTDDYLVKPFTEIELTTRIRKLLKNQKKRLTLTTNGIYDSNLQSNISTEKISASDFEWILKVEAKLKNRIGDFDYTLTKLAGEMQLSTKSLQSKIRELTGLTPKKYQRQIILQHARDLILDQKVDKVGELALSMGFTDQHYFSKLYEKNYGISPKDELRRN